MKLYKIIDANNKSCNGGDFDWTDYLPIKNEDGSWIPGQWTPNRNVEMCSSGWHVTDAKHALDWVNDKCYEVEYTGLVSSEDGGKYAAETIRLTRKVEEWNDKNLRLFACWCVRQFWHLLDDERSKNAVIVVERYANGEATQMELAAARSAWDAWAAARAAREAAWAAARAAWDAWAAARAAREAAWDAARAAQHNQFVKMMGLEEE